MDLKDTLHRYLSSHRAALVWKLDGLPERDARWPMTPTGTSLLGIVKHLGCVEYGYFGEAFDRPAPEATAWADDDMTADMWARADESPAEILAFYQRACAFADETIGALKLDAPGHVAWWREGRQDTTLGVVLTHVLAETARHTGHADILRELADGSSGMTVTAPNMPPTGAIDWPEYVDKLRRIAEPTA